MPLIAEQAEIASLATERPRTNGSAPGSVTRLQRRLVYAFVAALAIYLVARYTRVLTLFGIDVENLAGGISISLFWPIVLIGAFLAVGIFAARARLMDNLLVSIQNRRTLA
ncbi:MAG TPA: hypothetical protein VF190_13040, partial [Rhodothermales bacterium]